MIEDKRKIDELEEKISELTPEYKTKKEIYVNASNEYFKIKGKREKFYFEIKALKKKIQVETLKKSVGKGELLSFRTFFDEIRKGRDFTGKTMVWSSKDGKSGVVARIGMENKSVEFKSKWDSMPRAVSPAEIIRVMNDYPSLSFDEFQFDLYYISSLVSGNEYFTGPSYRTIDDVMIFICDKVTLADFKDVTKTKDMIFFEHIPSLHRSTGELRDDYFWFDKGGIPKEHYERYVLYPLKTRERGRSR